MPERRLVLTAEPTAGQVGRILREKLAKESGQEISATQRMQELFLFMADHAQHLTGTVIPSLEAGAIVLSDRYADSTAAYQGVTLRGIVPDPVQWIQNIYLPWNLRPDKTLLFLLDPHSALLRMKSRQGRDKFERLEFLQSVDENFRRMAALEPDRFVLINAGGDAEDVAEEAMKVVLKHLSR